MIATASFCCPSDSLPAAFDFGRFRENNYVPAPASIKVLNLLTNRYHVGIVRSSSDSAVSLELPRGCKLQAGQRVRFVVAPDQTLVARRQMQSAVVTSIDTEFETSHVELALLHEVAAA